MILPSHPTLGAEPMSIREIGNDPSILRLNFAPGTLRSSRAKSGMVRRTSVSKQNPAEGPKGGQNVGPFDDLQALRAFLNSIAAGMRTANRTMGTIKTLIDRMKEQLDRIVKNYPPFPPGSEERVKFLRGFKALRRQIDQLSFSPYEEGTRKITPDPANVSQAAESNTAKGGKGPRPTIQTQQLQTGATGINIPELSEDATDEEIDAALKSLEEAKKTLAQRESELSIDHLLNIQQLLGSHADIDELDGSSAEGPRWSDMTEKTAEDRSSEYKQILSNEPIKSLTQDQSLLSDLLR
ncbi:MAG: hypothetical protein ACUVWO_06100 [Thermodesulfobacteriota bacterium]